MSIAHDVVQRGTVLGGKGVGPGIHQVQGQNIGSNAAQQHKGGAVGPDLWAGKPQGQQFRHFAVKYAAHEGVNRDHLASGKHAGDAGDVHERGHAEFPAYGRHVPREAACLGNNGRGPAHDRHGAGRGVIHKHHGAFRKMRNVLAVAHKYHGAAAHAPGRHIRS